MRHDVAAGLKRVQKELPPKYFYDVRGSELFEEITRLDEYYPTRTERVLLEQWIPVWIERHRPRSLVELGAGSAEKTRVILEAMLATRPDAQYVPLDVSAEFLEETATRMRAEYPGLDVIPCVADFSRRLILPAELRHPALHAFLGSTIGNLEPLAAVHLLERISEQMQPEGDDRFLLGVDLHKDVCRIELAYNDARGVTAEFNRNVLHVLNRELGANFEVDAFEHRAFYDEAEHRIEMHLVATKGMTVRIPTLEPVRLRSGETIRTEISCKYERAQVTRMLRDAGLVVEEWVSDGELLYALVLATLAD